MGEFLFRLKVAWSIVATAVIVGFAYLFSFSPDPQSTSRVYIGLLAIWVAVVLNCWMKVDKDPELDRYMRPLLAWGGFWWGLCYMNANAWPENFWMLVVITLALLGVVWVLKPLFVRRR